MGIRGNIFEMIFLIEGLVVFLLKRHSGVINVIASMAQVMCIYILDVP